MPRLLLRSTARMFGLTAAALALPAFALPGLTSISANASAPGVADPVTAPITLWAPTKITAYAYRKQVWSDLGLSVIAHQEPFELWSSRTSYDDPIVTVWRPGSGDVALPAGSMPDFNGLKNFLHLEITEVGSDSTKTMNRAACLNNYSERVRPDAPARSDYPRGCYYNPYSLGSVQGVQEGWSTPIFAMDKPLRLEKGRYDVTAHIGAAYISAFGLTDEESSRTIRLIVKEENLAPPVPGPGPEPGPVGRQPSTQPSAHEPHGTSGGRAPGTTPDLRSLPAWGIQMANNGNYLQFSATVWNAGDSPLVVDGFRREGEDEMDAYQYFFDADGNQTGYEQVGHMHWDPKPTHQHWHFEDFATYTLLDKDQTKIVKSKKEAFCLANTDAVDQTVPNAAWNVDNSDLSTACGDYGSLSVREVLASGWGDTYAQFRAGQSFDLKTLPNGTYYIAVTANPHNRLIESSTANNVSLREIVISGKEGNRKVQVPQVGIIEEPSQYWN